VTQYLSAYQSRDYAADAVRHQFLRQLSERLADTGGAAVTELKQLKERALQRFRSESADPFRILADLRAAIYLNASYAPLLLWALAADSDSAAARSPEPILTSWRSTPTQAPEPPKPRNAAPTPEKPWDYHPFGMFQASDSMVLTEDDFFDYLIATSRLNLLLPTLMGRLLEGSLLFVGFRLDDWRFRVLLRLILSTGGKEQLSRFSHVGVQMEPDDRHLADPQRARKYLESYFAANAETGNPQISIYWGTSTDFLQELQRQLANPAEDAVLVTAQDADDWL
jgi:hypothetical protein